MKAPYFSISVAVGALLCAAVALSDSPAVFAQGNGTSQKPVAPKQQNVATDSEKTLIDKTLGGAIAPQDTEGLEGLDNYSGSLSDRIANDHPGDIDNTTGAKKPVRPKLGRKKPLLSEPGRVIVKNINPYAPSPPIRSNKVSFGSAPKITYIPGDGPPLPVLSADDIKRVAMLSGMRVNLNRLTTSMEEEYGLPPGISAAYNRIRAPRVDGMLPAEFMVKSTVDSVMKLISQRQGAARKQAASAAYDRLSTMADAMRYMKGIPASTYEAIGAPDAYAEDQKEAYTVGLDRLKEALEALDAIKKGD